MLDKYLKNRFYFPTPLTPTFYNLSAHLQANGWTASRFRKFADFSDKNLAFNEDAALSLEYKHLLAQLISRYCPEVMPRTYCINDQNWPAVLSKVACEFYAPGGCGEPVWILKPSLLNNGQQIKIFTTLSALEAHFSSFNRLGGEHVLQQYIKNPHLLRDSRKYSIRHFVVLTNYAGAFLYPQGYFNVALQPFNATDFTDLKSHLTNEHLFGNEPNVIQIPTKKFEFYREFYPQIKSILTNVISGLLQSHPHAFVTDSKRDFALFGMDFMIDSTGRPWLLEANHGPCFPMDDHHPLQAYLYKDFWQNIISNFVYPIASKSAAPSIDESVFEALI
ncbi:MAG: tubulin-tyrosine ligase [Legionella sp.]|nr:tubulin-tyrosine ligase [Legionella sp.]